jgi:hypothetical protein
MRAGRERTEEETQRRAGIRRVVADVGRSPGGGPGVIMMAVVMLAVVMLVLAVIAVAGIWCGVLVSPVPRLLGPVPRGLVHAQVKPDAVSRPDQDEEKRGQGGRKPKPGSGKEHRREEGLRRWVGITGDAVAYPRNIP